MRGWRLSERELPRPRRVQRLAETDSAERQQADQSNGNVAVKSRSPVRALVANFLQSPRRLGVQLDLRA